MGEQIPVHRRVVESQTRPPTKGSMPMPVGELWESAQGQGEPATRLPSEGDNEEIIWDDVVTGEQTSSTCRPRGRAEPNIPTQSRVRRPELPHPGSSGGLGRAQVAERYAHRRPGLLPTPRPDVRRYEGGFPFPHTNQGRGRRGFPSQRTRPGSCLLYTSPSPRDRG